MIKEGLEQGKYFEGRFHVSDENRLTAFVTVDNLKTKVMIDGLACQNGALDGDSVLIELYPLAKWPPVNQQRQSKFDEYKFTKLEYSRTKF